MASFYKTLNHKNDIVSTRTLLHEAIPLTGTIVSGTYSDNNIKHYTHGMFQSVYDYPYLSSSANHIFDITVGVSTGSALYASVATQKTKKKNIYNQMAQVLMGYDKAGNILQFDQDGDILAGGTKIDDAYFLNFSRLLVKDEIKKGSFELRLAVDEVFGAEGDNHTYPLVITDTSGSNGYFVNSPVGEYGILYATQSAGAAANNAGDIMAATLIEGQGQACGLIFYQAGVAVVSSSVFLISSTSGSGLLNGHDTPGAGPNGPLFYGPKGATDESTEELFNAVLTGSYISGAANAFRNRIINLQFNNTVELNSTVYFCRVNHNEYNYSSNPTYLSGSKLRVKTKSSDLPVSYITTIGLYSDNNELLAVSKLSEPLKKTPDTELTIRVRLDY